MSRALTRVFLGSSMRSVASAGLNLLTTVLLIRWFGPETYAHYIVDMAVIGLLLIVLEVVPSNYSVFRVQDDPAWYRSIAAQTIVSIVICAFVVFASGQWARLFQAYTLWMVTYAALMAVKRHLDIRLQSSGRLGDFMGIELSTSAIRLVLLGLSFLQGVDHNLAVWASLALAVLLSQAIWWIRHPLEFWEFAGCTDRKAWKALAESFPAYRPYYFGIALKRIKDNLIPLVAERLFDSRELLATFLLAYRGVIFAVGQVRILEAMMNYRGSLAIAQKMSNQRRYVVASAAQVLCLIASAGLLFSSGMRNPAWLPTLILSFMIWPIVFLVLERAKAYSVFQANRVNGSIFANLVVVCGGALVIKLSGAATVTAFSLVLVAAEVAALIVIKPVSEGSDAKAN